MMIRRLLTAWGRGYVRSCALQTALSLLIVPFACLCIGGPLWIVQNHAYDRPTEIVILAVPMLGFVGACLAGGLGLGGWLVIQRARGLDAAFLPFGLRGQMLFLNGRQYHGTWQGRTVDVYFQRGPALDLYLSTSVQTRVGLGPASTVGRTVAHWLHREPLRLTDPVYAALEIYALDENWIGGVLAAPGFRDSGPRLLTAASSLEIRTLHLQPGAWALRLRYTDWKQITAEQVRRWLTDLATLAEVVETLPPPAVTAQASTLETNSRTRRGALFGPALLIVGGIVGGFLCLALLPLLGLLLTNHR